MSCIDAEVSTDPPAVGIPGNEMCESSRVKPEDAALRQDLSLPDRDFIAASVQREAAAREAGGL